MNNTTLQKIHDISIVAIAGKLGFKLYGTGDEVRRACCPYHDDKHPSLHFSTKRGCFKCFVCGAKGDAIKLVQDNKHLSFTEACEWITNEFGIIPQPSDFIRQPSAINHLTSSILPLTSSHSTSSGFCKSLVSAGYLTDKQMRDASGRYQLGATKDGAVIFWEIDSEGRYHNGKIMHYQSDYHRDKHRTPTWVSAKLKKSGAIPSNFDNPHCLFGLHLLSPVNSHLSPVSSQLSPVNSQLSPVNSHLSPKTTVCLVEAEKSAVILSVHFPECIWLSCGGLQMLKPELLSPLIDYKVILFPDTDLTGDAYRHWNDMAKQASRRYPFRYHIRVSPLLEQYATEEQKRRKIDLVDYIFERQIQGEFSVQTT